MCSAEAVQFAGTTIQGASQMKAGREAQAAAETNARIANFQAEQALRKGRFEERAYRRQVERVIGSQVASAAAMGINPGSGTAADVQADTARIGELDALQIRDNAFMEAQGYRMQAKQYKRDAKSARNAGVLSGLGTLLGGYGTIYASHKNEQPPTLFGAGAKKQPKNNLGPYTFGAY